MMLTTSLSRASLSAAAGSVTLTSVSNVSAMRRLRYRAKSAHAVVSASGAFLPDGSRADLTNCPTISSTLLRRVRTCALCTCTSRAPDAAIRFGACLRKVRFDRILKTKLKIARGKLEPCDGARK